MSGKTLSIAEKEERYLDEYEKQEINLLLLYAKAMKLLNYQLEQVKYALIGGLNYKAAEEGKQNAPNPRLVKMSCDLTKTIKECTRLHIQITEKDLKKAGSRSLEDKIKYLVRFIKNLPPGHRQSALDDIAETLMLNIDLKYPVGRPEEGFVHPMHRD